MKVGDEFERPEGVRWRVVEVGYIEAKAVRVTPIASRSALRKPSQTVMMIPLGPPKDGWIIPTHS